MAQAAPRPSYASIEQYYRHQYRRTQAANGAGTRPSGFQEFYHFNRGESIAAFVAPFVHDRGGLRILDIGAGFGHVLQAMGRRFPTAIRQAVECSEACVRYLESLGVEVFATTAERLLPTVSGTWDLIVLSHVLEHVLDPKTLLEMLRLRLSRQGLLYVEVPNVPQDSLGRRGGEHPLVTRFDEPHLTFFSQAVLVDCMGRCDFDLLIADTAGPQTAWYASALLRWLRAMARRGVPIRQRRLPSFYSYGGARTWIRSLWSTAAGSTPRGRVP